MELSQILLLLLSLIPIVYLCFTKLLLRNNAENLVSQKHRLPPGSRGWPLIGENLEYFYKIREGVPEKFVTERTKKYSSNIFTTSLIGRPMAVLCTVEATKFLFSNEQKLVQVWWPSTIDKLLPMSIKKPTYEHSKIIRELASLSLKADMLRQYVYTMDAVMEQQLQRYWNGEQVIKVADMTKKYIFTSVCQVFLGVKDQGKVDELEKYMEDISDGAQSIPLNLPGTKLYRAIKASKIMRENVMELIRQRKSEMLEHSPSSKKDMLSQIVFMTDFCEEDIASYVVGFLLAGFSTFQSTMTVMMKYLAELPHVYNSVLREQKEVVDSKEPNDRLNWEDLRKMKYSWDVACEVLRLLPPGTGIFKEVISDNFTYEGYTLPRGYKIHWIIHAVHKNPEYFPDPEKFDPSRFQGDGPARYTYVPFGAGIRMCPGYEFARLAILVFVHNVVTKFKFEKLNPNEKMLHYPVPMPAQGLPIRLHPHNL